MLRLHRGYERLTRYTNDMVQSMVWRYVTLNPVLRLASSIAINLNTLSVNLDDVMPPAPCDIHIYYSSPRRMRHINVNKSKSFPFYVCVPVSSQVCGC